MTTGNAASQPSAASVPSSPSNGFKRKSFETTKTDKGTFKKRSDGRVMIYRDNGAPEEKQVDLQKEFIEQPE